MTSGLAVAPRAVEREQVLTNARLVRAQEVVTGSLVVADGVIREVQTGVSHTPGALDLDGDLLLPGLVDLHTDNLEKHYQPRTGVEWDGVAAAMSHDTQIAGSGITTVLDSLTLGAVMAGDARARLIGPMVEGLRIAIEHDMLRAEHWLHLRCEVTHPNIVPICLSYADDALVRFMSLMDHAPGDRQLSMEGYRQYAMRMLHGDRAAVERHIEELVHNSRIHGPANRRQLAQAARERGLRLASHDDARAEHIAEAVELGAVLSEFPTTVEAADAARRHGLRVLMGAPNLIRGRSHSGNVAATTLAERDRLDILSSDFIPASLIQAAFKLTHEPFGWSLPRAIATVTATPAAAAGFTDRGRLEAGLRADLVRVRRIQNRAVVRMVWSAGTRVA